MEILNSEFSYLGFFESVRRLPTSLLLLDYDGTLSPFTPDRDAAIPYDGVLSIFADMVHFNRTRLVIVSGRSINSLKNLIGNDLECELWGSHGLERIIPGKSVETVSIDSDAKALLETIDQWAKNNNLSQNLETKPLGRAFHWRGEASEKAAQITKLVAGQWVSRLHQFGFGLHSFDGGLEIRPEGVSKADAVNTLLNESPDVTAISYLGDDLTDEDAFRALGNRGLKVLVRSESRPSLADIRVEPPGELLDFLRDWLKAIST